MYEREIYELSKLIPQEEVPHNIMRLDMQRLGVKIEKEFGDWEFAHPKEARGGYTDNALMQSREVLEVQSAWRTKWF